MNWSEHRVPHLSSFLCSYNIYIYSFKIIEPFHRPLYFNPHLSLNLPKLTINPYSKVFLLILVSKAFSLVDFFQ